MKKRSIGIIGNGLIGSYIYDKVMSDIDSPLEIAFVYDTDQEKLENIPDNLLLDKIENFMKKKPDMVCELAHARVSIDHGIKFLRECDYFALSVTALADKKFELEAREVAAMSNTCLYIPHGGVLGLADIIDGRKMWDEVSIIMKKKPENLDFSYSGIKPSSVKKETVLYDGTTRDLCKLFPRNVNTHATLALGGIGLDNTRSILVSSPDFSNAVIDISAKGNGVFLDFHREETITGVTGASTLWSVYRSILSTTNRGVNFQFC